MVPPWSEMIKAKKKLNHDFKLGTYLHHRYSNGNGREYGSYTDCRQRARVPRDNIEFLQLQTDLVDGTDPNGPKTMIL